MFVDLFIPRQSCRSHAVCTSLTDDTEYNSMMNVCTTDGLHLTNETMASGINIYSQLLISLIRIVDISNSNC